MKSKTKLVATLFANQLQEALSLPHFNQIDVIEWRLDALKERDLDQIKAQVEQWPAHRPKLLLTLRTEGERPIISYKEEVAQLAPFVHYIDLEWQQVKEDIAFVQSISQQTQVILSYHHFHGDWPDIEPLLFAMSKLSCQHLKIALNDTGDVASLIKQLPHLIACVPETVSIMVMGRKGQKTRYLAPSLGEGFVYASGGKNKYGQLTIEEMLPYMEEGELKNGKEEKNS